MPSKGKKSTSNPGANNRSLCTGPVSANIAESASGSNSVWDDTRVSKWTPEAIEKELENREEYTAQRRKEIDRLKNEGNRLYQAGDYRGALTIYASSAQLHGKDPTLCSNMAQALLKLGDPKRAHAMATIALEREPANLKARYRRGMARKGLGLYLAALADLSTVMSVDSSVAEARQEHQVVTDLIKGFNETLDDPYVDDIEFASPIFENEDPDYPPYDQQPRFFEEHDVAYEETSLDTFHTGNGIACRYYNRGTCIYGESCKFSHAPDYKSKRDKLGRNICTAYLWGGCKFGDQQCYYLHDKTYLDHGWWHDEETMAKFQPSTVPSQLLESPNFDLLVEGLVHTWWEKSSEDHTPASRRFDYSEKAYKDRMKVVTTDSQADKRFVMVLALDEDLNLDYLEPTLSMLRSKLPVQTVRSSADALKYLSSPFLVGIFAVDGSIADPVNSRLLARILEYVKTQGRLVLGGKFCKYIQPVHIFPLFEKFGFQWVNGGMQRATISLNGSSFLSRNNPSLPTSCSIRVMDLLAVRVQHAVYLSHDRLRLQNPPSTRPLYTTSPVAYAPVEKGFLGYIGDVNWGAGSIPILLAMLGLLDTFVEPGSSQGIQIPHPIVPPTPPSIPTPCSSSKLSSPDFILLSLALDSNFSVKYDQFLSALGKRINYQQVTTSEEACRKLESPHLRGIFVTDGGVFTLAGLEPLFMIVDYVAQQGGSIVFGAEFCEADCSVTTKFFHDCWKLSWQTDYGERLTGVVNFKHGVAASNPDFAPAYTMKGSQISGVRPRDAVVISYNSLGELPDESDDGWESDDGNVPSFPILGNLKALIASTKMVRGRLSYVGDNNLEPETIEILLELLCPAAPSTSTNPSSGHTTTSVPGGPTIIHRHPFALFLTFDHDKEFTKAHSSMIKTCEEAGLEVIHGLSIHRIFDLMKSPDLAEVFVPYADIVKPEHACLVTKLVEWTKSGGTVIFGGYFARSIRVDQIGPFFRNWNLTWKAQPTSPVTRDMVLNVKNAMGRGYSQDHRSPLPQSLQMTALQLSGISENMAVYAMKGAKSPTTHAPVIEAHVGYGKVGYVGETSFSEEHVKIVLAMLCCLS